MDYISAYFSKSKNDEIIVFVESIGVNEDALRKFLTYHVNVNNIDEYGRFEKLKQEVDIDIAQKYFEKKEGAPIPRRKIHPKVDKVLRDFILYGIFEP